MQLMSLEPAARGVVRGLERQGWRERSPTGTYLRASPDDPALTGYWDQRRRRTRLPVDPATWHLLRRQRGRCPLCRGLLLHAEDPPQDPEDWQQWHTATRKAIRKHAITSVMDLAGVVSFLVVLSLLGVVTHG